MRWILVLGLLALPACASAGKLVTTFTFPTYEQIGIGPDTCLADTVREQGPLVARRTWTGPATGSDVLNGLPGAPGSMEVGLPNGTYQVSVTVEDPSGNRSCPATRTAIVKGRPARIQNLGELRARLREIWLAEMRRPAVYLYPPNWIILDRVVSM